MTENQIVETAVIVACMAAKLLTSDEALGFSESLNAVVDHDGDHAHGDRPPKRSSPGAGSSAASMRTRMSSTLFPIGL